MTGKEEMSQVVKGFKSPSPMHTFLNLDFDLKGPEEFLSRGVTW